MERDEGCVKLLTQRQREGLLHPCKIYPDVRGFSAKGLGAAGVASGFPCQAITTCQQFVLNCITLQAFDFDLLILFAVRGQAPREHREP